MSSLQFNAPPLPYYLACGEDTYQPGQKHPARKKIGMFDLLLVTAGCLFMGEEAQTWDVRPGQALILRPDCGRSGFPPFFLFQQTVHAAGRRNAENIRKSVSRLSRHHREFAR